LPIPILLFTAHWLLHLKVSAFLLLTPPGRWVYSHWAPFSGRLIGGWLMDRMVARYAFMLGLVLLFSRLIPGDPGFSGRALDRL